MRETGIMSQRFSFFNQNSSNQYRLYPILTQIYPDLTLPNPFCDTNLEKTHTEQWADIVP
jgi:hypothetical protein